MKITTVTIMLITELYDKFNYKRELRSLGYASYSEYSGYKKRIKRFKNRSYKVSPAKTLREFARHELYDLYDLWYMSGTLPNNIVVKAGRNHKYPLKLRIHHDYRKGGNDDI